MELDTVFTSAAESTWDLASELQLLSGFLVQLEQDGARLEDRLEVIEVIRAKATKWVEVINPPAALWGAMARSSLAFLIYCKQKREQTMRDHPNLKPHEVGISLLRKWCALDSEEKAVFIKQVHQDIPISEHQIVSGLAARPGTLLSNFFNRKAREASDDDDDSDSDSDSGSETDDDDDEDSSLSHNDEIDSASDGELEAAVATSPALKRAAGVGKKVSRKQAQPEQKRAKSAYMLFCEAERPRVKAENPDATFVVIVQTLAKRWSELDPKVKAEWELKAKESSTAGATISIPQKKPAVAAKKSKSPMAANRPIPTKASSREDESSSASGSESDSSNDSEGAFGQKKPVKRVVRDPNAPKRPMSPYMYFSSATRDQVRAEHPEFKFSQLALEIGNRWKSLTDEQKKPYFAKFEEAKEAYAKALAEYNSSKAAAEKKDVKKAEEKEKKKEVESSEDEDQPKGKKVRRDPNMPKRNKTAYMIFVEESREPMRQQHPEMSMMDLIKAFGAKWVQMTGEEKAPFTAKAAQDKERYEREMAAYQPIPRK